MKIDRAAIARLAGAALVSAGIVAAWRWRGVVDPRSLAAAMAGNPLAPLAFVLLHVAASLFFVPRTVLALSAGLVFGIWWGIVWAALGSAAGAVAGFLVARHFYAGMVERVDSARLQQLLARAERGGWRMVACVRLMPIIPHSLTNYALGLTRVRIGAFAFGSLLGQLPLTIAYVDLGAAGGRAMLGSGDWRQEILWPSLIGVSALTLSLLAPLAARWRPRHTAPGSGPAREA